jgi:hypothetical protein
MPETPSRYTVRGERLSPGFSEELDQQVRNRLVFDKGYPTAMFAHVVRDNDGWRLEVLFDDRRSPLVPADH